jgi:SAM-dependent methyltransferase
MTAYDQFAYEGNTFSQTHPRKLQMVGKLFGLDAPNIETCSVLELGCGDGANIIPMAFYLPQARFVGVDLAAIPVEKGQQSIAQLGLSNIQLLQGDVSQLGNSLGQFDYIIAHGLYSWVPAFVREAVLGLIQRSLTENGVAYLSYNALPGCRLRHLPKDMLHFRFGERLQDPKVLPEVRAFLSDYGNLTVDAQEHSGDEAGAGTQYQQTLKAEINFALSLPDYVLFHDDLSPFATPFYLHEFATAASLHQLQYLGEARVETMFPKAGSESFVTATNAWSPQGADPFVSQQQFLDFAVGRRFKQSLLCRASPDEKVGISARELHRKVGAQSLLKMHLRSVLHTESNPADSKFLLNREVVKFVHLNRVIAIDEPLVKIAMHHLAHHYPNSVSMADLIDFSLRQCISAGLQYQRDSAGQGLANVLWSLLMARYIEVFAQSVTINGLIGPDGVVITDGQLSLCRPVLNALARAAIVQATALSGAMHEAFELKDEQSRNLALQMDGTKTVAQLAASGDQNNMLAFVKFLNGHGVLTHPT